MSELKERIVRAFTRNSARTHARSDDRQLRGRTLSIPFEDVWRAALRLAGGELRGMRVVSVDDLAGKIVAEGHSLLARAELDVMILITLDPNAQTRVDMRVAAAAKRFDLGACRRLIVRFFGRLDQALAESDRATRPSPLAS